MQHEFITSQSQFIEGRFVSMIQDYNKPNLFIISPMMRKFICYGFSHWSKIKYLTFDQYFDLRGQKVKILTF